MPDPEDKITIQSITSPHHIERVNRAKHMAMREALLTIMPAEPPGITPADALNALLPHLDSHEFPDGAKAGWWLKAVQLDLEAKGVIRRGPGSPVRLCGASKSKPSKST